MSCRAQEWIKDIEATKYAGGHRVTYPIIADPDREVAGLYGMLDPDEVDAAGMPLTCRGGVCLGPVRLTRASAAVCVYGRQTGPKFPSLLVE
jgi:peroxiredoxin 6